MSKVATQTTQRSKGREALLEAAVSVIAEQGSGGATVRAVAERAGVSPGTVTYHFANADELVVAALEYGASRMLGTLEQLALDLQQTDWDTAAWTRAFCTALAADIEHNRENHLACMELQLIAARRPRLLESARRVQLGYARVARMVIQAQNPGLRGTDLDIAAVNLTALVTALVMRETVDPQPGAEKRLLLSLGVFDEADRV